MQTVRDFKSQKTFREKLIPNDKIIIIQYFVKAYKRNIKVSEVWHVQNNFSSLILYLQPTVIYEYKAENVICKICFVLLYRYF